MRALLFIVLCGLMDAARSFSPEADYGGGLSAVTLAGGFLLLTAFLAGSVFRDLRLPRLTGYLAAGVLVGPHVLGLVSEDMVLRLRLFSGIAISLIALTAGAEIELRSMRPYFRSIRWITLLGVVGAMIALAVAAFLLRDRLAFLAALTPLEAAAVALTIGVMLAAQSPAVVVALRDELHAEGPVTRTVLGVVVISDLVVILLFALASSLAKSIMGLDQGEDSQLIGRLLWEIVGSLVIGVLTGALVTAYLRLVRAEAPLTMVVVGFLIAEVGQRVHLDPLLLALGAGLFVRNFTAHGERLLNEVQSASMPIYVIFFALAGAAVHVDVLAPLIVPVSTLLVVRAVALTSGTALAARIAQAPLAVRRYAGFGLLPQAGLALALAMLFSRTFPSLGAQAAALVFGVVAVNEIVSPILYRYALVASGEAGKRLADDVRDATPKTAVRA